MATVSRRREAQAKDPFDPEQPFLRTAAEHEFGLLSALLSRLESDPSAVLEVVEGVDAAVVGHTDFGNCIFRAILATVQKQSPSAVAVLDCVREELRAGSEYEAARGFFTDLVKEVLYAGPAAIRIATERLEELRKVHARRLWHDAVVDAAAVSVHANVDEMAACEERLRAAREALESAGNRAVYRPATGLVEVLDRWAKNEREPVVPTMFSPIDRRIGGLPVGLTAIAAQPSKGKSALAGQLTLGALLHDPELRAVWFRGEMTNDLLASKYLATWVGLRNQQGLCCGFRDALNRRPQARQAAMDMIGVVGDRLTIIDPPLTPDAIERHVVDLKPRLVVVDYLQLCEVPGSPDKRSEVEQVVRRLAMLSTKYEIAILVVSSISGSKTEDCDIGQITKETNLLDYSAHTFLALWPQDEEENEPREFKLKVLKSRTAAAGSELLWFDGRAQIFRPAADDLRELEALAVPCPALARFAPEGLP